MKTIAELQVIPIGNGVSVRKEVVRVVEMLRAYDFVIETHAAGTDIEGEMSDILAAIHHIHKTMHEEGTIRLISYLKLETRTDKPLTLSGKRLQG
jgi:uncharacterized protein (TIGR00106 family)